MLFRFGTLRSFVISVKPLSGVLLFQLGYFQEFSNFGRVTLRSFVISVWSLSEFSNFGFANYRSDVLSGCHF